MKTVLVLAAALVAAPGIAQPDGSTLAEAVPTASTEQLIAPVQSPAVATIAPAVATIAPAGDNVLRAGSTVSVRLLEELTTERKLARVGQRFRMEIAEPVKLNGKIVIPAGSPAQGEITSVRNKGMWGKSGHITARVLYATVGGRQIRLSGTFDDKGVTGTAGVVGSIAL